MNPRRNSLRSTCHESLTTNHSLMQFRTFGRTGWQVSEIGYGMWGLAGWTGNDDNAIQRSLDLSVELGCNFFDTAWGYGAGKSEQILGSLLRNTPAKNCTRPPRFRPKTLPGPPGAAFPSTNASRPTTSANTPKRASEPGRGNHRPPAVPRVGRRLGRR
jgi:hypothetical protein